MAVQAGVMGVRDDLLAVIGFVSRLPVPPPRHGLRLADAAWAMPLAALVVAAPPALMMAGAAALGMAPLAAATLGVGALIAISGGLHEDGLADCADGFWGGHTRERRLEIMKDPRVGTFGVLALVLAAVFRIALVAAVLETGVLAGAAVFVAAAVAGRTCALYPWVGLPPAREGGLAVAAGRPGPHAFRKALVVALVLTFALALPVSAAGAVAGALAAAAAARGIAALADEKIGGHTGDVIGAAVVAGEAAYLAAMACLL